MTTDVFAVFVAHQLWFMKSTVQILKWEWYCGLASSWCACWRNRFDPHSVWWQGLVAS